MDSINKSCESNSDIHSRSVNLPLPTSGIRTTVKKEEDPGPTSSMMPCQHCSNEKIERRKKESFHKRCYYCNEPEHQIISCKTKENDEATQLLRQAINTGIQRQDVDNDFRQELIVTGTEGGLWSEIWYVSTNFKHHYAGNLDVFKRIKHMFGVETKTGENNFLFIRGNGVVDVKSGSEVFRIQGCTGTPLRCGERRGIFPTFSVPVLNTKNEISGLIKEDEIGIKEKQAIIDFILDHDEYKTDYLNSYFENLNLSSQEPDWNVMIFQALKFHEFQDCKALLDMLEDVEYVSKYKYDLEIKFDEMLEWFIKTKLGISTRSIPVYSSDKRKINLLELYVVVKREGGHKNVTLNDL
ncbi:putative transcription factor interactor and regulator CCHC(Zn) family [Helianthus debilis subsp. tardiflorus]